MNKFKKAQLLLPSLMILLTINSKVFADQSVCDSTDAHCAYITGVSNNDNDGRYVKLATKGQTAVICMNSDSDMSVTQDMGQEFLGKNSASYYICKDQAGNGCQLVGTDNFVINKNNNSYQGTPQFFNIDLSKLQNQYPKCNASPAKFKF